MKKYVIYLGMALVLASCSKQTTTDEVDGQQVSPEVAKKNTTAPIIITKINILYISVFLEILLLLLRNIINKIIIKAITIINLTIFPIYIEI